MEVGNFSIDGFHLILGFMDFVSGLVKIFGILFGSLLVLSNFALDILFISLWLLRCFFSRWLFDSLLSYWLLRCNNRLFAVNISCLLEL
jgi:hypothetical protein